MFIDRLRFTRSVILNYILSLICLKLYFDNVKLNGLMDSFSCISEKIAPDDQKANVNLIDLNQPLEPKHCYEKIQCRESSARNIKSTICIHDPDDDIYVSKSIWNTGLWEKHIIGQLKHRFRMNLIIF